ncbi:MAG: succinate:quinone oxidoreductase [Verrucomicrobiales bacterium]|nr:succinate:quinone oxidoreductase [Verrucomicrobiales bacterium]
MSITGFALVGFVVAHMIGNLQVFLGAEAINRYGYFLQSNVELLWPARIGLLVIVFLHIWSAIRLTAENRAARPVQYSEWNPTVASYASRTMMMSGLIVAAFVVYHILHFTVMTQQVNLLKNHSDFAHDPYFFDAQGHHDIYRMMVVGFRQPLVSLFYIIAVGLLCLHLSHGIAAMFQSLGWKKRSYARLLDNAAKVVSWVLFLGYISIPVSILVLHYGGDVP